jgi:hypothetical protein
MMLLFTLQQVFALVPSVSAQYLIFGLKLLHCMLLDMPEAKIVWPSKDTMAQWSAIICVHHPPVKHVIGFVDGVHLPLKCHSKELIQNTYYNGWYISHFMSNIFAFGVDSTIMYCIVNAPGSWHDAVIAEDLYYHLLDRTPKPYHIVSDTTFLLNNALATKIKKPLKQDFCNWPQDPLERAKLFWFNRYLVSYWQVAEWGMGSLQGSFGWLHILIPSDNAHFHQLLLLVICWMHQLQTRLVGMNQIKNVYERA